LLLGSVYTLPEAGLILVVNDDGDQGPYLIINDAKNI